MADLAFFLLIFVLFPIVVATVIVGYKNRKSKKSKT